MSKLSFWVFLVWSIWFSSAIKAYLDIFIILPAFDQSQFLLFGIFRSSRWKYEKSIRNTLSAAFSAMAKLSFDVSTSLIIATIEVRLDTCSSYEAVRIIGDLDSKSELDRMGPLISAY